MQEMRLGASGLYTDPSELEAPKGALREALNVRIKRANVIEPRPGFPVSSIEEGDGNVTVLGEWENGVLCIKEGDGLFHFTSLYVQQEIVDASAASLVITDTDSCLVPVADVMLVPTDNGIYAVDRALNAYPASLDQSLPPIPTLTIGGGSVLADDEHFAARSVVVQALGGGRLVFSAPSAPVVAANETGGFRGVSLRVTLGPNVVAGMRVHVYRTDIVGIATPTGDEMALVRDVTLVAGDITAGYLDVVLSPVDTLGASLYTNETQEGILQANAGTPNAKRIGWYKQMAFYGDISPRYAYRMERDSGYIGGVAFQGIGTATSASSTITGLTPGHAIPVGSYITRSGDATVDDASFSAFTRVTASGATTLTIDKPAIGTFTGTLNLHNVATVAGNEYIQGAVSALAGRQYATTDDLVALINADGDAVGSVISSGLTPRFVVESDATFSGSSLFAGYAFPVTPVNAVANTDTYPARLMWSKSLQPESVPAVNYLDIGSNWEPIIGLGVTRDALFVLKTDGVWRVTGDSPETLRVDEYDRSIQALHPRAVATMDDMVWAWTTSGIVGISDGGIQRVSDPSISSLIEDSQSNVLTHARAVTPVYLGGCFIGACQSESILMVGVPAADATTTTAPAEYIYALETKTGAWVRWQHSSASYSWTAAGAFGGKMLLGGPNVIMIQADDTVEGATLSATLSASAANAVGPDGVTYPGTTTMSANYSAGIRVSRGSASAWPLFRSAGDVIITNELLTDGIAVVDSEPMRCRVEWVAFSGGDSSMQGGGSPSRLVHWRGAQLMFGDAAALPSVVVGFSSERVPSEATVELRNYADPLRPEPVTLRGSVTRAHARCARLRPSIDIKWAAQAWRLEGVALTFEPMRGGERMP